MTQYPFVGMPGFFMISPKIGRKKPDIFLGSKNVVIVKVLECYSSINQQFDIFFRQKKVVNLETFAWEKQGFLAGKSELLDEAVLGIWRRIIPIRKLSIINH